MTKTLSLATAGYSLAGQKEENQDAWTTQVPGRSGTLLHKGAVLSIADGVSACTHARDASHTTTTSFTSDYYSTPDSWTVRHGCAKVLSALNRWLYQQGNHPSGEQGSWCTTFTAIVLKSTTAHLLHIGDSRAWRYRPSLNNIGGDGQLECLTRDHTATMGGRHFLGRALGMSPGVEVDYQTEAVEEGDLLLLTTDGVHDTLSEQEILDHLQEQSPQSQNDLANFCQTLVEDALEKGSTDNLTCVAAHVLSLPDEQPDEKLAQLSKLRIPPDLYPGQHFEGYRILEEIHASSRSQLYLAEDSAKAADDPARQVILKTPSVNFEDDPEHLERFVREEWLGRRISHPAIMEVYAPKPERRHLYHACEYIQGQTLRAWMQDNVHPHLGEAREFIRQIISAIRAVHRLQILHQDLKPENIMIDRDNRIRLIDFGAAHITGEQEAHNTLESNIPPGTKNYIAPEYFLDGAVDERSDQFSIAVIAYELLTGHLPYKEQAGSSVRVRHYTHLRYRSARRDRADIPLWVDQALAKALSPNPAERYTSMSEFIQDLSHPNPSFQPSNTRPLLERNPVLTWQLLAGTMLILNLLLLFKSS